MRAPVLACLLLVACGGSSNRPPIVRGGPDLATAPGGLDGGGGGGGGDCSDAARLVYVIDASGMLSSFAPDKLQFTDIGAVHCGGEPAGTVNSMAVDRNAVGWINFQSGAVYTVSITDPRLACNPTRFKPGVGPGFTTFGMGFSTNTAGASDETLFIAGPENNLTNYLAVLDIGTLGAKPIGAVPSWPELTGTGDAKLFGFFPDTRATRIAELDKATAKLGQSYDLQKLNGTQRAWAFAFWGGDFWIFLKRDVDTSTNVWHLHLFDAGTTVTEAIHDTGREIVGAGVSTCAPLTIG